VSDPPTDPEPRGQTPPPRHTLDPDRAIAEAGGAPSHQAEQSAIDTRRYRWMIGIFGLVLVVAFSVYEFTRHGVASPGVPAGKQLHKFVAPLATIGPDLTVNTKPRCDPAHPNPLALNVCGRTPLVLAFFVTGSGTCKRQVDTLQAVSRRFAGSGVQFAAVAISASRAETRRLVRAHHWTIPVAFDSVGRVGALYGVEICPMLELARAGGTVQARLIGARWLSVPALTARVRALLAR
jgi:Redoxin